MNLLELNAKKTALVLIDLQNLVVGMPTVPHPASQVVDRSKKLAESFRSKGGVVVYVRVDVADFLSLPVDAPHRDPNAPPPPASASEIAPNAGFQSGDLLITKRHWGAFAGTNLEQELKSRGVETVVLTGIATSFGVESTVRQGSGLGFAFVLVEDACSDISTESHQHAFGLIFPRLGRVRSTVEVIAALG